MENKVEKCDDCVVGLFRAKPIKFSQVKLIPWYDFDKLIIYKSCPNCKQEVDEISVYLT